MSDAVRQWTATTYGIHPESVGVIHNGVDGSEFHPAEDYLEPRGAVMRVICHGRIDPNKGHDAAARAVATLRHRGAPITFTLVGGVRTFGLPQDEVAAFVDRLDRAVADAEGTVVWMPATEVAELLRRHDVCCVLSRNFDPMPLTVLEGMASGCAMITTDLGGLPEAIGMLDPGPGGRPRPVGGRPDLAARRPRRPWPTGGAGPGPGPSSSPGTPPPPGCWRWSDRRGRRDPAPVGGADQQQPRHLHPDRQRRHRHLSVELCRAAATEGVGPRLW